MTLSDLDLETRLRAQRTRADEAPPAPSDLVQRVRERAREQRRRRIAVTAAGVAAALVFVGVSTLASGLIDGNPRGEAAAPSSEQAPVASNFDLPTRGSLAADDEWVAGVRALSWVPADPLEPDSMHVVPGPEGGIEMGVSPGPDPALEDRKVAFAGDVPGGRVALVLGRLGPGRLSHAWYTGPEGAEPEAMTLATRPWDAPRHGPMALFAKPDPESDTVVVVVGQPDEEFDYLVGREVAASGEVRELWEPVPGKDGAGAMAIRNAPDWPPTPDLVVRHGEQSTSVFPDLTYGDSLIDAHMEAPAVEVADPRGLLGRVDPAILQGAVLTLMAHYGLHAEQLDPTLLASGPVGDPRGTTAVMVGITFPSGATLVHVTALWGEPDGSAATSTFTDPAPAGPSLLDRVFAVPLENSVVISGPAAGVLAEVYLADGTLLASVPLVDGAGSGPLPPPAAAYVRILDASGGVVAESPLMGQDG